MPERYLQLLLLLTPSISMVTWKLRPKRSYLFLLTIPTIFAAANWRFLSLTLLLLLLVASIVS